MSRTEGQQGQSSQKQGQDQAAGGNAAGVQQLKDTAAQVGQQVKDVAGQYRDQAREQYDNLRQQASDYYDQGRQQAAEWQEGVESYVQEQPVKALLIAAGVGMLLGILWKRS